jgi:hypothetical protein
MAAELLVPWSGYVIDIDGCEERADLTVRRALDPP